MKRPVESIHKMELRTGRGGQRKPPPGGSVGYDDQDTDHGRGDPDPLAEGDTDNYETASGERNDEPRVVNSSSSESKRSLFLDPLKLVFVSSLVILLISNVAFSKSDGEKSDVECEHSLNDLFDQYPEHKSFWKAVNTSFKMCTNSLQPGVTLVLHNGDGSIADCLVNRTASYLSHLIGTTKSGQFGYVNGKNAHHAYGKDSFLENMLTQRENLGILVFNNLEDMDLELVQMLHFICDTDPNIKGTYLIILLLKVEVQNLKDSKLSDLVNNKLAKLWQEKLPENRYGPIIARITNTLGYIDENIPTKCP